MPPLTPASIAAAGPWGADTAWSRDFADDTQERRVYRGCLLFAGANNPARRNPPPWSASRGWIVEVDGLGSSGSVMIGEGRAASIESAKDAAELAVDEYLAGLEVPC